MPPDASWWWELPPCATPAPAAAAGPLHPDGALDPAFAGGGYIMPTPLEAATPAAWSSRSIAQVASWPPE